MLAVHRAVRHCRDTLNKQREIEQIRARIADLEGARPAMRGGPPKAIGA